jgi:hypothetical protein
MKIAVTDNLTIVFIVHAGNLKRLHRETCESKVFWFENMHF